MADTKLWKRRVAAWRASGLSSTEFCAGRDFTPGGLRHWAYRLRTIERQRKEPLDPPVRLVRVERAPTWPAAPRSPAREAAPAQARTTPLLLEVQGRRIRIAPGFDPATLTAVLDVLEQRSGRAS